MKTNKIVFPISLSYVDHWEDNGWPILRELATNAMDTDPGFRIVMGTEENSLPNPVHNAVGTLFVRSKGSPLAIRHLLFGVSEKSSPNAVGQFGEGLKLALLALTRTGLTAHIYTGGRHIWNEPAELHGEQVFKVVWEGWGGLDQHETCIEIADWPFKTFEERFVRPGDPRILFTDPFERSILEETSPNIYVKGVYVQRARGFGNAYTFGYNLQDVEMNRDRGVVDSWNVNAEVGKIWASVTDEDLLERFWQSVKDMMAEKSCYMHGCPIANKKGMKRAFQEVYGNDAVLETNESMSREASYQGANVISAAEIGGGAGLKGVVSELVGTDAQYVAEMEGGDRKYLPDGKLSAAALKTLKMLRRMAKRIGAKGKVFAYILPDDVNGESYKQDIRISLAKLHDDETALAVWLHEEAHRQYGTADATAAHVNAVVQVAARVIASYACRR